MQWPHPVASWSHLPFMQELGFTSYSRKRKIGSTSAFAGKLCKLYGVKSDSIYDFNHHRNSQGSFHGAILNLTFSPNGHILAAATERKSILLFDPLCHKLIYNISNAHNDSVNCIKFLDEHLFASASDDTTVSLWDCRMTRRHVKQLDRYPNPVKNLEYDFKSRSLIVTTTDFDGSVYLCPVYDTHQNSIQGPSKILHVSCVMKCKLNPDGTKLIFGTSEGYLMVIHDLDLSKITMDLAGFQSDLYRLMQRGHSFGFDFGSWFNYLFTSKRNRVELISDFPPQDDAHVITSLEVHPQAWTILSRNITRNDDSEWTCVHDIQDDVKPTKSMPIHLPKDSIVHTYEHPHRRLQANNESQQSASLSTSSSSSTSTTSSSSNEVINSSMASSPSVSSSSSFASISRISEMHMSPVVIISARSLNRRAHATILSPNTSYREIKPHQTPPQIYMNVPRLMYHVPEPNTGHGYSKDPSFSRDGRLICSPYENGFRILSFDQNFNEICNTQSSIKQTGPQELVESLRLLPHNNYVLSTKFSPTHELIASGCLGGRVVFTQPSLS